MELDDRRLEGGLGVADHEADDVRDRQDEEDQDDQVHRQAPPAFGGGHPHAVAPQEDRGGDHRAHHETGIEIEPSREKARARTSARIAAAAQTSIALPARAPSGAHRRSEAARARPPPRARTRGPRRRRGRSGRRARRGPPPSPAAGRGETDGECAGGGRDALAIRPGCDPIGDPPGGDRGQRQQDRERQHEEQGLGVLMLVGDRRREIHPGQDRDEDRREDREDAEREQHAQCDHGPERRGLAHASLAWPSTKCAHRPILPAARCRDPPASPPRWRGLPVSCPP